MSAAPRDPRQDPRAGDRLRDDSGRVMLVEACYSLPHRPRQWQVRYTAQPGGAGCVCGLSNWRRYYKRAEVLHVASESSSDWPRADPAALAKFDPASKVCNMNCGPATGDPRSRAERLFLCDDC
ncbi:TPA: hypothetical protein ACIJ26_005401 [Pseudomonas aeruginosa]